MSQMKPNFLKPTLLGTLAGLSVIFGIALAADSGTQSSQDQQPGHRIHGGHHGRMAGDGPFMHAVHQLNLSDDQKQRIHSLIATNREQMRANFSAQNSNRAVLANPGDPNYASAVEAAKASAARAIQQRSDLQVQIYGVLNSDQQTQLPKVLDDMKARAEQRRMEWQHHAAQSPTSGS